MMIASPTSGAPAAAAAPLDRASAAPATSAASTDDASSSTADASPDVVVTLGGGRPAASTYDATGRLPGGSSLNDLGANGPTSLAHATESMSEDGGADAPQDAPEDAVAA